MILILSGGKPCTLEMVVCTTLITGSMCCVIRPGFYVASSGYSAQYNVNNNEAAVHCGGVSVVCPIVSIPLGYI